MRRLNKGTALDDARPSLLRISDEAGLSSQSAVLKNKGGRSSDTDTKTERRRRRPDYHNHWHKLPCLQPGARYRHRGSYGARLFSNHSQYPDDSAGVSDRRPGAAQPHHGAQLRSGPLAGGPSPDRRGAFFGFALRDLGLAPAVLVVVLVTAWASRYARLRSSLLLSVGLAAFCAFLFIRVLGLPLPLTGPWLNAEYWSSAIAAASTTTQ